MGTRGQALQKAASYLGYVEQRNRAHPEGNVTLFWDALRPDYQGGAWCASFVNYCLKFGAGITVILDEVDHPFYTPSMEAWARRTGRWIASKDGQPGDVLIFTETSRTAVHTGFLERQRGDSVQTIEGNTSPGNRGSQANGGGVYRRVRARSWVRGCIDMSDFYSTTAAAPTGVPARLDEDGAFGPASVDALQWYLRIPRDGVMDRMDVREEQTWLSRPRTGKLVADDISALQRKVGAGVDGEWGKNTTLGLQRWLNKRIGEAA